MRVSIITHANNYEINKQCEYLESQGYTIIDVILQQICGIIKIKALYIFYH